MISGFRIPTMTKRVTLWNLISNGSFEDSDFKSVSDSWTCWLADPTDTSQSHTGTQALKLGGDALASNKSIIFLTAGHKYYGREYLKTSGDLTASDCRFELCGTMDDVEKSFIFGWNRGNHPDWTPISDIVTVDTDCSLNLRTFTVGGSVSAWVDSIILVDLTEDFGEGNEPSKEWCDENIPFFDWDYSIDIPLSSPIQALVQGLTIPEGVVTRITDSSGRVLWKLPIFGSVILRPSADISVGHSLYPADSPNAYSLINEEVSDGTSTYIYTESSGTSQFRLSGEPQHKIEKITSVTIKGEPYDDGTNTFYLYVNGVEVGYVSDNSSKEFDIMLSDGISEINEYLAENGELPVIDLRIHSSRDNMSGTKQTDCGVSQVYVVLGYEA